MKDLKSIGIFPAIPVAIILAMMAMMLALRQNRANEVAAGHAAGQSGTTTPGPGWALPDIDGKTVHSSDFKGKVVLLDFWATWCGPCRAEIPSFIALQHEYATNGLIVVGVSMDEGGAAVVKKFAKESGMDYPLVLADDKMVQAFGGIEAIPATFIIDREGRIVKKHLGLTEQVEFETEIKPLLTP